MVCKEAKIGEGLNKSVNVALMAAWELDGSSINLEQGVEQYLSSLVSKHLFNYSVDDKNCELEMSLEKLVLYEQGSHVKCPFISSDIATESSKYFLFCFMMLYSYKRKILCFFRSSGQNDIDDTCCRWSRRRKSHCALG